MHKKIIASIAFTAAAIFAAPAFAETENTESPQAGVRYTDLDLNNDRDAARLLRRLDNASERVCEGHRRPPGSLLFAGRDISGERQAYAACRAAVLEDAVATFNHPVVNALYASRGGQVHLAAAYQ